MKRTIMISGIILGVIVAALISACVPAETRYVCSDGSQVSDASQCPVNTIKLTPADEPAAEETPPEEEPAEEKVVTEKMLSDEAKALFDKAEKVSNIKFNYLHSDDPYTQNKYTVTRQRMKIELIAKERFSPNDLYDTVYLDFRVQDASAYCEQLSSESCPDRNKMYSVSYERYKIRTPYNWLDLVEEADTTGRSKQISGRQAKEVTFTSEGKTGVMWLDSFFGIPLEVEYDGIKYAFQSALINDAKDSDLHHQALE